MADSGDVLRELVECAICFGVLENPYQLTCLHTFCHGCILKLVGDGGRIPCPNCRAETSKTQIKKDFKSESIVNLYKSQQQEKSRDKFLNKLATEGEKVPACHVCEKAGEIGQFRCTDCDQVMCPKCEKIHRSIKSCKKHTVIPSEALIKLLKQKVGSEERQRQGQINRNVAALTAKLGQSAAHLSAWQAEMQKSVEEKRKYHLSYVENYFTKLQCGISKVCQEAEKHLEKQKTVIEKVKGDSESLEAELDRTIQLASANELLDLAENGLRGKFHDRTTELSKSIEGLTGEITLPPMEFVDGGDLNLHAAFQIKLLNSAFNGCLSDHLSRLDCNKYQVSTTAKLSCIPQRLRLIKESVVCIGSDNSISVYDQKGQLLGQVLESQLRHLRSLTEVYNGFIVAACDRDSGLHLLNHEPKYVSTISMGSYCDVAAWAYSAYALEYEQCKVLEFQEEKGKWAQVNEVKMNYGSRHSNSWDTLAVNGDGIFVCAMKTCSVYHHSHSGQLLQQFGEKGSGELGRLRHPRLALVDGGTSVLVVDTQNNRLQVYSTKSSRWSGVDIDGLVQVPLDASVSPSADTLWIVQDRCGEPYLTRCEKIAPGVDKCL